MTTPQHTLSADEIRKIGTLARLALSPEQVEQYRSQLAGILGYVDRLRELDLSGLEPLAHVGDETNRLDTDEPGTMLANEALMRIAPAKNPPFIQVPKVFGGGEA